jgi:glycosyltransferase involved in cell wall biosynthesis
MMSARCATVSKRILQIAHNHPTFYPGGTELTALALHREALEQGLDSWYLGALDSQQSLPNLGTQTVALSADHRESAIFTDSFIRFGLEQPEYMGFLRDFSDYLLMIKPDVIHFHHLLMFGLEAVHTARKTLPDAKLVLTAHDFYLICPNNGQLYKHDKKERCPGPALRDCVKCFSGVSATDLSLRKQDIAMTLRLFDSIAVPSHLLKSKLEDYLDLTQPVKFVENAFLGRTLPSAAARPDTGGDVVFGYFGNISQIKGLSDLLDAADILTSKGRDGFRIHVHGAQLFNEQALTDRIAAARHSLGGILRFFGGYKSTETAGLMGDVDCVVFPSLWWENAPLVIYEALQHRRQVIAYPHGGAAEILARYGAGLVADRSTPEALAAQMERVLDAPALAGFEPAKPIPDRRQLLDGYFKLYL